MANGISGCDSLATAAFLRRRLEPRRPLAKLWLLAVAVAATSLSGITAAQQGTDSNATAPQGGTDAKTTAALSCVKRPNVRRMQIVDSQNILFVMRDKTTYRNSLARECPALRRNSQISLTASDSQLCSGASFQVMMRVGTGSSSESVMIPGGQTMSVPRPSFVPGPVCNLGAFTAITEADAAALVESSRARRREEQRRDDEAEESATPEAR